MRLVLLLAACLLAGCTSNEPAPPEARTGVDVLGDVVSATATVLPATVGGAPAPALRVAHAGTETVAAEGQGVSIPLSTGGATLRLIHHGEWVRTSLRWTEEGCVVTLRTPTVDQARNDPRLSVDSAVGPAYPYGDYAFSGTCSGRAFVLWRGPS